MVGSGVETVLDLTLAPLQTLSITLLKSHSCSRQVNTGYFVLCDL